MTRFYCLLFGHNLAYHVPTWSVCCLRCHWTAGLIS